MQKKLLIGDVQNFQENIGELLEMNGYEVLTVPNGVGLGELKKILRQFGCKIRVISWSRPGRSILSGYKLNCL